MLTPRDNNVARRNARNFHFTCTREPADLIQDALIQDALIETFNAGIRGSIVMEDSGTYVHPNDEFRYSIAARVFLPLNVNHVKVKTCFLQLASIHG